MWGGASDWVVWERVGWVVCEQVIGGEGASERDVVLEQASGWCVG